MTSVASASSSSASPSSSSFPSSSLSSALSASPSDVSARLGVLAATSGDFADAAHKAVALDGLRHRCIDGQRTREQAALLCTQLIHGDVVQPSLLTTFRRWVQADAYAGLRAPLLELLIGLCLTPLTRDSLTPGHCQSLMAFALFVVRSEAGSRVREKALELMDRLLSIHRIKWDTTTDDADHITPAGIIDILFKELGRKKSALTATVRGLLYSALGGLSERFPDSILPSAGRVAETLCRALQEELESSKEPSIPVLVGALRGMTEFLCHFSHELTKPRRAKVCDLSLVYRCMFKGLHHQEATRYSVLNASLNLLKLHASLFRGWLVQEEDMMKLLSSLLSACRHTNADVSRIAPSALDAFLLALVDALVQEPDAGEEEAGQHRPAVDAPVRVKVAVPGPAGASSLSLAERRRTFALLLHTFRKKLEEQRTITETSLAIRAFGYLARAVATFLGQAELTSLLTLLFQSSDALFQATTLDERDQLHSQFSAFLSSFALILHQVQRVDPSLVDHLHRLVSRFFHVYPNLSDAQKGRNVMAFTKLLVVLHHQHPQHFQVIVDAAVQELLLLTISRLPEQRPTAASDAAVRLYGREAYVEYSYLWLHLLGVWVPADGRRLAVVGSPAAWNLALDYDEDAVKTMRRGVFDALMQETIRVLQQLDLTLQPADNQQTAADDGTASTTSSSSSSSASSAAPPSPVPSSSSSSASYASLYGSELSSQLHPSVPKDYQLFLNLVDFLHRFLLPPFPSASLVVESQSADYSTYLASLPSWVPTHIRTCLRCVSRWLLPWLFPFGSALVHLSSHSPLVSGFYKLTSLLITVGHHYHHFDRSADRLDTREVIAIKEEEGEGVSEEREKEAGAEAQELARSMVEEKAGEARAAEAAIKDRLNRQFVVDLLRRFLSDVFHRMAPFTAELLFSCIRLLLSAPSQLSPLDQQIPLLRRALQLGLTYPPAAELAIGTMERWNAQSLLAEPLRHQLPSILPLLQDYLRVPQPQPGSASQSTMTASGAPAALLSRAPGSSSSIDRALAFRLLELLGSMGGVAQHVLDDPASLSAEASALLPSSSSASSASSTSLTAWSTRPCVRYPLPFTTKLDVELDGLLPRLAHLAQFSSHRPIKVAAAESLHAIVIFMIAQAAKDPNRGPVGQQPQQPVQGDAEGASSQPWTDYSALYQPLFPVLLRLACDGEVVLQKLFTPLVTQLIHWYTNREQTYVSEMRMLLDALCEGVGDPVNSGLRHLCASSLAEFFLWSRKRSGSGGDVDLASAASDDDTNVRSLMKRLFGLCRHPSSYKRLGASLTLNRLYRHFREDDRLIEFYTLHILLNLLSSLQIGAAEDDSTATPDDCRLALDHFLHILVEPSTAKWKLMQRRVQRDGPEQCQSLDAFIDYLLTNVSRHEEDFRRQCMALFTALAPHSLHPHVRSGQSFIAWWSQQKHPLTEATGAAKLLDLIEQRVEDDKDDWDGVALSVVGRKAIDAPAWVEQMQKSRRARPHSSQDSEGHDMAALLDDGSRREALRRWFDSLSATLDNHQWFISAELTPDPLALLSASPSHLAASLQHFIACVATLTSAPMGESTAETASASLTSSTASLSASFAAPSMSLTPATSLLSFVRERQCTLLLRLFRLLHLVFARSSHPSQPRPLLSLLTRPFFTLLWLSLLCPEVVGVELVQEDRVQSLQAIAGLLAKTVRPIVEGGGAEASAMAHAADSALREALQTPTTAPAYFTCRSLMRNAGLTSVRIEGYQQLWSSGWLQRALGSERCQQLAHSLLMETVQLPAAHARPSSIVLSEGQDSTSDGHPQSSLPSADFGLSPLLRHVGHQLLHFALHMRLEPAHLLSCLLPADSGSSMEDVDGADGGVHSDDRRSTSPALNSAFYRLYRSLLDSYLSSHLRDFAGPLLRASAHSLPVFDLFIHIGQAIGTRRDRKSQSRLIFERLQQQQRERNLDQLDEAQADDRAEFDVTRQADSFVELTLRYLPSALGLELPAGALLDHAPTSIAVMGRKPSARHRTAALPSPATSDSRVQRSFVWPADRELSLLFLQLLDCLLALNAPRTLDSTQPSFTLLTSLHGQCIDPQAPLLVKRAAISLLPSFLSTPATSVVSASLEPSLLGRLSASLHTAPFPLRSTDLRIGSTEWRDYTGVMDDLLSAIVRSRSFPLLRLVTPKLSERDHAYRETILQAMRLLLTAVNEVGKPEQPQRWSEWAMDFFLDREPFDRPHTAARCFMADFILVPLLRLAPLSVVRAFYDRQLVGLWERISQAELNSHAATADPERLRLQSMRLESDWHLVEVLFARVGLDEVKATFERLFPTLDVPEESRVTHVRFMKAASDHVKKVNDVAGVGLGPLRIAAYAALVAGLCRTQGKSRHFVGVALQEKITRGELLWSHILDVSSVWRFRIDDSFMRIEAGLRDFVVFRSVRRPGRDGEAQAEDTAWRITSGSAPQTQSAEGMSRYLSSQYLADSSLSQDALGVFGPDRRALPQPLPGLGSQGSADGSVAAGERKEEDSDMLMLSSTGTDELLDLDVVLAQPAMPVLLSLVDHLEAKFGAESRDKADMPEWQKTLLGLLTASEADADRPFPHVNVRWSVVKLVVVKWQTFAPWASSWWRPLAELALFEGNGGVGFHYQLRDICVTFLRWEVVPSDSAADRRLASRFVNLLIANSADHGERSQGKRAKLRSNLQIVRLFVERWKARMNVDKTILLRHLAAPIDKGRGGKGIDQRNVGVQLLAILASQSLHAYDPINDSNLREEQLIDALIDTLGTGRKALYEPAAEVFGLILRTNAQLRHDNSAWLTRLRTFLEPLLRSEAQRAQVLDILCKVGLHAHQLGLLNRPIVQEVLAFPFYTNDLMVQMMQVVLWSASSVTGMYDELLTNGWLARLLTGGDSRAQELLLLVLFRHLDEISVEQLRRLSPELTRAFSAHPSEQCRALYYKLVIYLKEQHVGTRKLASEEPRDELTGAIDSALINGLSESSADLRAALFSFFDRELPSDLPSRLLAVLTSFHQHSPASVARWLSAAVALLLQPMRRSSDFSRPISDMPLQECKYTVMDIFDDLQSNTAAFTPLFSASPPSAADDDIGDEEDGAEGTDLEDVEMKDASTAANDGAGGLVFHPGARGAEGDGRRARRRGRVVGGVRATQAPAFPVTQSLLSMDAKALMDYNLSQQSQSEYLFYRPTPADGEGADGSLAGGSLADFHLLTPQQRLAKRKIRGRVKERGPVQTTSRVQVGNELLRLRFYHSSPSTLSYTSQSQSTQRSSLPSSATAERSGSEAHSHWAAFHDRRAKAAAHLHQRLKEIEANQVSLFRSYRTGELPDIQILHREMLEPLIATHQDQDMAKRLFTLVVPALYSQAVTFFPNDAEEAQRFRRRMAEAMLSLLLRLAQLPSASIPAAASTVYALQAAMVSCSRVDGGEEVMTVAGVDASKLRPLARLSLQSHNQHAAILWFEALLSLAVKREAAAQAALHAGKRRKDRQSKEAQQTAAEAEDAGAALVLPQRLSETCHFQLGLLYSSLGSPDTSLQLYSHSAHHPLTRSALHCSLSEDYVQALAEYDRALDAFDAAQGALAVGRRPEDVWKQAAARAANGYSDPQQPSTASTPAAVSCVPSQEEVELWNRERLEALKGLTSWSSLRDNVRADVDDELPRLFQQDSEDRGYLDYFLTASIKQVQEDFIFAGSDEGAMVQAADDVDMRGQDEQPQQRRAYAGSDLTQFLAHTMASDDAGKLETPLTAPHLLLFFAFQGSKEAARALHYLEVSHLSFLQQWEQLPPLAFATRARLLQGLQKTTEVAEFIRAHPHLHASPTRLPLDRAQRWSVRLRQARDQLDRWSSRLPSHVEALSTWDDLVLNRSSFLLSLYDALQVDLQQLSSMPEHKLRLTQLSALATSTTRAVTEWLGKAAFVVASTNHFTVAHKYLTGARRFLDQAQQRMRLDVDDPTQSSISHRLSYQVHKLVLLGAQRRLEQMDVEQHSSSPALDRAASGEDAEAKGAQASTLADLRAVIARELTSTLADVVHEQTAMRLDDPAQQRGNLVHAYHFLSLKARINQQLHRATDAEESTNLSKGGRGHRSRPSPTYETDAVDELTTLSSLFAPLASSTSISFPSSPSSSCSGHTSLSASPAELKKAGKAFLAVATFANERLTAHEAAVATHERGGPHSTASWLTPSSLTRSTSTTARLSPSVEAHLRELLIVNVLHGMRVNERNARLLFPRALEMAGRSPLDSSARHHFQRLTTGKCNARGMQKELRDCTCQGSSPPLIPVWQLIAWIPQLLSCVGLPEYSLAGPILHSLASTYPHAVYFPFHLSRATYREKLSAGSLQSSAALDASLSSLSSVLSSRLIPLLIEALDSLTPPEIRFTDFLKDFREAASRGQTAKAVELWTTYRKHWLQVRKEATGGSGAGGGGGGSHRVEMGQVSASFARKYRKPIELLFHEVTRTSTVTAAQVKEINTKGVALAAEVAQDREVGTRKRLGAQSLASFSSWLMAFQQHSSALHELVEVPGQYGGDAQPLPSRHVTIVNFARELLVLGSIRKPKRVTLLGSDQREYPFLVKAGEDLRLDERIEQLFGAMNGILASDRHCSARHFALTTYTVVPLAPKLGWIQWLPHTVPVKELFRQAAGNAAMERSRKAMEEMVARLSSTSPNRMVEAQNFIIEKVPAPRLIKDFRPVIAELPPDLFQRFLLSLSSCPEAFLVLRSTLLHSYSVMALSQWVLGIGDRHTDNFLFDLQSGQLAAIDFGMAFGQGQLLRIPELIPLRFSPQFQSIAAPLDTAALVAVDMEMSMQAYHAQQQRLLTMLDVFVREPHIEWIEQARNKETRRRQQQHIDQQHTEQQQPNATTPSPSPSSSSSSTSSLDPSLSWYPREKLLVARAKLNSANPAAVTSLEISDNQMFNIAGRKGMREQCVAIIEGREVGSRRSQVGPYCGGVKEQVELLIEQSTDLNILGRTYIGWTPQW